jgi:DNA-binding NarL/FixJ family response regulator
MNLTKEESKIINLMTEGYTVHQISKKMDLRVHVVAHRTFALRKRYKCKSTIQLVVKLIREELLMEV